MRDLVQEIKEIEELNRLFPPIPVTSHGPAEQITDHEEATNDLASSLRRELKALTLDDNHDAEDNLNSVSPPPYRQVVLTTTAQSQAIIIMLILNLGRTSHVRMR